MGKRSPSRCSLLLLSRGFVVLEGGSPSSSPPAAIWTRGSFPPAASVNNEGPRRRRASGNATSWNSLGF